MHQQFAGLRNALGRLAQLMPAAMCVLALGLPTGALAQAAKAGAPKAPPANPQAAAQELEALIKAARAEGEVLFYSSPTENVATRVRDAFMKKYGVKAQFLRLTGAGLLQRYASEAEAGTFAADVITTAGDSVGYAEEGIRKGWIEPVSAARLPVLISGEFPAQFMTGPTAIIQISPWGIAYNTEKVRREDVPKDWPDILHPRFNGQINLTNPRSSDAHIDYWTIILDKYGEAFFAGLRAQNGRQFNGGVPSTNALAAGEGSIQVPATPGQIQAVKDKGAPVGWVAIDYSTGVEIHVALTHRGKARRPAAGRLLAHFMLTEEGNKIINSDPGSVSVYDTKALSAGYQSPKPGAASRREQFLKLLGFS
ncbi:MAG: extracellular solute-binding protein [Betaproteobacteria bacterium]|nr:extracellular solute-binding protein [Betaproteobacteria bacterium]